MVEMRGVRDGMQVLGSDGGMIGAVAGVHGDHLHVRPTPPDDIDTYIVPFAWVARVDDHVHLNRDAALVRDTWKHAQHTVSGHEREAAHTGVGRSWLVWLIGAVLLLLVLVAGLRGCGYAVSDTSREQPAVGGNS